MKDKILKLARLSEKNKNKIAKVIKDIFIEENKQILKEMKSKIQQIKNKKEKKEKMEYVKDLERILKALKNNNNLKDFWSFFAETGYKSIVYAMVLSSIGIDTVIEVKSNNEEKNILNSKISLN